MKVGIKLKPAVGAGCPLPPPSPPPPFLNLLLSPSLRSILSSLSPFAFSSCSPRCALWCSRSGAFPASYFPLPPSLIHMRTVFLQL